MADTARLDQLTDMVERTGAKLVAIGDGAQLPSIGAGGMFDRLAEIAPSAELSDVRRTMDPAEQRAWADLRAGRSDRAMAHYLAKRTACTCSTPATRPSSKPYRAGHSSPRAHPISEVALISDASNKEIDRLNARAQHYRAQRGELGDLEVEIPGIHYGIRQGDRVALIEPAPRARQTAHRERQPRRGPRHHTRRRGADRVRRHRPATDTRRRRPRPAASRLRAAHPPRAGRDRHPHARRDRRLADEQGARLRRGVPRPPRHRLVCQPRRARHRRPRHRPHQTPRPQHEPQPRPNSIARAPRATRSRMGNTLPHPPRTQP